MKLRFVLASVIFMIFGLVSHAQVTELLYQGFEDGETQRWSVNLPQQATVAGNVYASGTKSMELTQATGSEVSLILDTLDLTSIPSSQVYITLEFDHISRVPVNTSTDYGMCRLYFKRAGQSNWTAVTSQYYNCTNGCSDGFTQLSSFSIESYSEWGQSAAQYALHGNEWWKSERFDFNSVIDQSVAQSERKLIFKFELRRNTRTGSGATPGKWMLDNIKFKASPSPMVDPVISMTRYPDLLYYASSRGARVELTATTSLAVGINPDSVYLYYRVGSDPTPIRLAMPPVAGVTNRYGADIPFCGYDTMMYFYCVARDATTNANMITYPATANSWIEYKCVRGVAQPGLVTPQFTGTGQESGFPFPQTADSRSEFVYDSARLAAAGYGPGTMTSFSFTVGGYTAGATRPHFQIKMKNVPTNYTVDTSIPEVYYYTTSFMQVVYDSVLVLGEANAGAVQSIQLQTPFRYAGKDIIMQVTYDGNVNVAATPVRYIPTAPGKRSFYRRGMGADAGLNPFEGVSYGDWMTSTRPAFVFNQSANLPLLYDLGFDTDPTSPTYGLITPNNEVPMSPTDHSIQVRLKNLGAMPVNAVGISYSIDGGAPVTYAWSNSSGLAADAVQAVTIAPNVSLAAGFHTLKVWVEDTLTAGGMQYRDHEPYNDTIFAEFIVCAGPMHGVRNIGGASADFNTIEEFLFALSRCGIDDSLIVRLAPGQYKPFVMPDVYGLSASNYIVFEPQSNNVTLYSDTTSSAPYIVNLAAASNVRFRDIKFVRRSGALTDMVFLDMTSANCRFERCSFIDSLANPAASMRIGSMINSGFATGLMVDSCVFEGGKIGVNLRGQASDIPAANNTVKRSRFANQYDNAVKMQYQSNAVVENNEMNDVLSNTSYVLLVNECSGATRIMANKIYTSCGAGAMGVSGAVGTQATHFLIANNMLVCNDNGAANNMSTPFNIIQATWADVVYNSVKMTATRRNNVAAAAFGGGVLENSRFVNNVVVTLDNTNYALNYVPGTGTGNEVSHNVYYSLGNTMNRKSGASYADIAAWRLGEPADSLSISTNPNFLNGSRVDLRTYNRLIKGVGMPLANVTTDMFGTPRSTTASCPGAFEFVSLTYDFEPEALISPELETCNMPASVELKVRLRNSGVNAYTGSGMSLFYKVNNGAVQSVAVSQSIPAEDTVTISTGAMLQLPPNGIRDSLYQLRVWTVYSGDPNQTNDTNTFMVNSKYHPSTPSNMTVSVNYAEPATITPTAGVDTWPVYVNTSAPQRKSEIYWYYSMSDADPFYVGPTLTTDTLRTDTVFYFRQRRAKPIVRITQLEFARANTTQGLTPSMPYWMVTGRKIALQLTNIGDAPACLYGDTIQMVSPTSGLNNKIFTFTDSVYIQPGQSLVVQYATGTSANPSMTVLTGSTFTVAYNSKVAFVYRRGGVIEDVLALNSVTTDASSLPVTWANINVPSYVWTGAGVNLTTSNTTAGVIRTGFLGNNTDWTIASSTNPMFLNTINPSWIRYTDNGCEGGLAQATVSMIAPPSVDLDITTPVLPDPACGLGLEDVTVTVRNYGIQPVSGVVLNYNAGGSTVTENVPGTIAANGSLTYTFNTKLNMAFSQDSTVTVRVWANAMAGDPTHANDTNVASTTSYFTPVAPASLGNRQVDYASRDTVTHTPTVPGTLPVWYDYDMNPVDTGNTHISEILYVGGTMGMSYLVTVPVTGIIGTGTSMNSNTGYPSPYQPGSKFAKQQYIYTASELHQAGLEAGNITSVAFNLKQFVAASLNSVSFDSYTISMGMTADTIFSGTSAWKSTTPVFSATPMVINRSDCDTWVTHTLSTPFYWDGHSSLVVQVVHEIGTAITSGVKSAYTTKTNTTLYKNGSSALSPSTMDYVGVGTRGSNRPNVRFGSTAYGCSSPITNYTVEIVNMPSVDMAVMWPAGVDTLDYNSCDSTSINVVVRNQGQQASSGTKLYYYLDNHPVDSVVVAGTIASGQTTNVQILRRVMVPGRHHITVIVAAPGDNVLSNDTIYRAFVVRFCGRSYTIAPTNGDYSSFGEAIDTLNVVGIEGPVVFNVANGTYVEQVVMNAIQGSSTTNTVSFIGTGDSVLLTAATTQNDNYVMMLDSASNVFLSNFRIEARPTATGSAGNYANALILQNGSNINVTNCTVRVKGTVNNVNASCVILGGHISGLTMTGNVIDSGYYSLRHTGAVTDYDNILLYNNIFKNFWYQGINLRGITNIEITSNEITSGVTVTNRGLTGIYLAQTAGSFSIKKNKIYLIDEKNGGKRGIQLELVNCTSADPGFIVNNMISCSGTGVAGLTPQKPSGIWIDSSSSNLNVLYNTVRVYCGPYTNAQFSDASYSFYTGATVSNIHVMNNILSNFSKGYAYYVSELNTVTLSNFNAYYSISTRPFTWKQNTIADLPGLQAMNTDDGNSLFAEPFFVADNDLHMVMTNLVSMAQYSADVPDDIDGRIRPQIPAPTIGAHEMEQITHDMSVLRVIEPIMPASLNFSAPNNMPPNIEHDSVRVMAEFYNNGRSTETNVLWYAYIVGDSVNTFTGYKNMGTFAPAQRKIDSVMMPTPFGLTDTHTVRVVVVLPADTSLSDNVRTTPMFLAPAYNFAAVRMSTDHTGCSLQNTTVRITIKNDGFKDVPAGTPIKIGYYPLITSPSGLSISTFPDTVERNVTIDNNLLMAQSVTIDFPEQANFYPTDTAANIKFRLMGWCHHDLDVTPTNDSTSKTNNSQSPIIDAYYTPDAPIGFDTTFAYGTWGAVRAMQVNSRPIRWYRDSTAAPFYHPTNYNTSRIWSNTPQYFHDSTYYLNCLSDKNCASNFSQVTVHVAPLIQNDMAFDSVLAPLGGRVYMENDTVRVRIANYGTRTQTNVPITYQLKKGNNIVQTITEMIPDAIASTQTFVYTFDSLLNISTPTQNQNYTLTVWTDLATDEARRNDTIRTAYTFRSLPEGTYTCGKPSHPSFDVTRVSFNEIDLDMPPLGRGYTNLASYANPDYPVLHVTRGTSDSLIVQVTPLDREGQSTRLKIWAYIDFNRNGNFDYPDEEVVHGDNFYDYNTFSSAIAIPASASYGYMRMRISVGAYADFPTSGYSPTFGIPSDNDGHNLDFLLFVDANAPVADLSISQIASPRSYLILDNTPRAVSFRITNKGAQPVYNPQFNYSFVGDTVDPTANGTVSYNGTIAPGTSAIVNIPAHVFPLGTSTLTIWHSMEDDVNRANDTLVYEYHRFHVVTLTLNDDFDHEDMWYAPTGYNAFSRNYWQLGSPTKQRLSVANSEPNAWVTDLHNSISSGTRGNVSYLYSPIIDISQVKADTLSFYLRRHLLNGSSMHVEFYNYESKWVTLAHDSATHWYNNMEDRVFDGTTTGSSYTRYYIPTSLVSGDFQSNLQLRLVYTTPLTTSASTNFGEGCAVDNFRIGRARARWDAGVIEIVEPNNPQYGQTYYPSVVVKNYGTDTLRRFTIGYTHYGTRLPKETLIDAILPPNAIDTFRFDSPFTVTSNYPDSFYIEAFTSIPSQDIYLDNDSTSRLFYLMPLDNDISIHEFIYPLDNVVAGDTNVPVTIRIRNFGMSSITTARASYIVNNQTRVDEDLDFVALLGHPLETMEYFNYTFSQRIHASMGVMKVVGIIKSERNDYIYNDTISKRIEGVTSVTDIAAAGIIVDTSAHTTVRIQLVIENRGSRGVNGFQVGFYLDDDSTTNIYRETYNRSVPLAALETGYYMFNTALPSRTGGYPRVTGFVHLPNNEDIDASNDTTSEIVRQFVDLEPIRLMVRENAEPDCPVYAQVTNRGNVAIFSGTIKFTGSINGKNIMRNITTRLEAGQTLHYDLGIRVPKDPNRSYVGSVNVYYQPDVNHDNDQTSRVDVVNYYNPAGVPTVETSELVLDQNYPNPFTGRTTIPFTLPNASDVHIFIIDIMGHVVYNVERFFEAGDHAYPVDMSGYPAGIYYYGIEVNGQRRMRKLIMQ